MANETSDIGFIAQSHETRIRINKKLKKHVVGPNGYVAGKFLYNGMLPALIPNQFKR